MDNRKTNWNVVKYDFLQFITDNKIDSFDAFSNKLMTLDSNLKGQYFEYFYKLYFTLLSINKNMYKTVYLFSEIPKAIINKLKLPYIDKGIDGLLITKHNDIYAVQVKFRSNQKIIPFGKIATFPALSFGTDVKYIKKGVLFTNCYDVCNELKNDKYYNITYPCFDKCDRLFWKNVVEYIGNKPITHYKLLAPLPHQLSIIAKIYDYYKINDNGRLYLPCGTGKTFIGYWTFKHILKCNSAFIAVPSLYLLSETYETWIKELQYNDPKIHFILIGSDMDNKNNKLLCEYKPTTDVDTIKTELKNYKHVVTITTYQSSDLLLKACKDLKFTFDFGIYDEAHRTAGETDKTFTCLLSNRICKKKLFMTATEKVYFYKKSKEGIEHVLSMDNIKIYGDIICHYSTRQAIDDNQLVDYKIVAPFIPVDYYDTMLKDNEYITIKLLNNEYDIHTVLTAVMTITAMKECKFTHLLLFSNKNKKAHMLIEIIKLLLDNKDDIYCKYLSGNDSMNLRKREVKIFEQSSKGIISSAKIFGEGVNIPICDAVCFVENKGSYIDIVQFVGRCLRKTNLKIDKQSYVLVPFLLNEEDDFFDSDNRSFLKLRTILKTLGTTDNLISEKFMLMNCNKLQNTSNNGCIEKVIVGTEINIKEFEQNIISKIFDRTGDPETRIRNMIINENKKRYDKNEDLIDTKEKCINFLIDNGVQNIPVTKNWVKYCLGNALFDVIKGKYYYTRDELLDACIVLGIYSFNDYEKKYILDSRLPTSDYINDGFYCDMDEKFNLSLSFITTNRKFKKF